MDEWMRRKDLFWLAQFSLADVDYAGLGERDLE